MVELILISVIFFVVFLAVVPNYLYQKGICALKEASSVSDSIYKIRYNTSRTEHCIDSIVRDLMRNNLRKLIIRILQNQRIDITRQGKVYKVISTYKIGPLRSKTEHCSWVDGEPHGSVEELIAVVDQFSASTSRVIALCTNKTRTIHSQYVHKPVTEKV